MIHNWTHDEKHKPFFFFFSLFYSLNIFHDISTSVLPSHIIKYHHLFIKKKKKYRAQKKKKEKVPSFGHPKSRINLLVATSNFDRNNKINLNQQWSEVCTTKTYHVLLNDTAKKRVFFLKLIWFPTQPSRWPSFFSQPFSHSFWALATHDRREWSFYSN